MPETIEAEVIEIDGGPPPENGGSDSDRGFEGAPSGRRSRVPVIRIDRRWWPLWAVFGVVAVVLIATVGVVLGLIYVVFAMIRGLIRGLFGGWPDSGKQPLAKG